MGKVKSAIILTFMSLLIAALMIVCFVPIQFGLNGMERFDPIVVNADRDPDLGTSYGAARDKFSLTQNYNGGGVVAVYYPEGVVSAKEYDDNVDGFTDESKRADYEEQYAPVADGALYLEKKVAYEGDNVSDSFKEEFEKGAELLRSRFGRLHEEVRVEVADEYTVRVTVPRDLSASLTPFSYMGDFTVSYGTDEASAEVILPYRDAPITDYVKGAHTRVAAGGTPYVVIDFTKEGRKIIAEKTADAAENAATMFFKVGDNIALQLSVSEQIDRASLFISSSDFTSTNAKISAILIDTSLNGVQASMSSVVGDTMTFPAFYGENAMLFVYIAFGVLFAAMLVFFFVRYALLGFVNLYTYLLFVCVNLLCVWAIPFLDLSVETVIAFLLVSVLLAVSNAVVFEGARKEFALGKTIVSSVKGSYKRNFWHIFDLHVVLAIAGFVTFGVALGALRQFAFVFGLGTVFSGIFTLAINRLNWATMMAFCKNKGKFCNYKRVEAEDDE